MTERTLARPAAPWLAWALAGLSFALAALWLAMVIAYQGAVGAANTLFDGSSAVIAVVYPAVGLLITLRRRDNRIGWLMITIGLSFALSCVAHAYTERGPLTGPHTPVAGQWMDWLGTWVWVPGWTFLITLLLLLFPDGHPPSPRWRPAIWATFVSVALLIAGSMLDPDPGSQPTYQNPTATPATRGLAGVLEIGGVVVGIAAGLVCVAALITRFRRSQGEQRQQMKWFAYAGIATLVLLPGNTALATTPLLQVMGFVDVILLPAAIGIALFLLFPDGRVPSRRWRPVLWLACAAPAVTALLFALTPGRMTGAFADLTTARVINPTGIAGAGRVITTLSEITGIAALVAGVLAGASLVTRFRSRRGDERQQIKWLAFVGVAFLAEFALTVAVAAILGHGPAADAWGNAMYAVMFGTLGLGIPAACAVAILKYRLYDIDVVISKTLVYAVLAAFITAVYVLLVVGIGSLVGLGGRPSLGLSILATALVAVAFQPVRARAQRLANRLVYGQRATPYQALAQLSERMAGTYATESLLPTMATIVAGATGASRADVWLRDGGELRAVASWPSGRGAPARGRARLRRPARGRRRCRPPGRGQVRR